MELSRNRDVINEKLINTLLRQSRFSNQLELFFLRLLCHWYGRGMQDVIVIPWFVRVYEEIQVDKPWYNYFIPPSSV